MVISKHEEHILNKILPLSGDNKVSNLEIIIRNTKFYLLKNIQVLSTC